MAINNVTFSGNLTADPRKAGKETPILGFSIAVNCPRKVQGEWVDEPMFIDCALFGERAKKLSKILCKGMAVTVQGRMTPSNWTDKDGNKRIGYTVNVAEIVLPPKGNKAGEDIPFDGEW